MLKLKLVGYQCPVHAPKGSRRECCGISRAVWARAQPEPPRVQPADMLTMREFMRRRSGGRVQ